MPNSLYTTQPANQRPIGNLTMPTTVAVPEYGSTVTDTMGRRCIHKDNKYKVNIKCYNIIN